MAPGSMQPEAGGNSSLLFKFLEGNSSISFIRYCWLDYSGILLTRVVPKLRCLQLDRLNEPLSVATGACTGMIRVADWPPGFRAAGSDYVYPDWSSLRLLSEEHASVMCDYMVEEPVHIPGKVCPRSALKRVVEQARDLCGVEILAGFELEFWLTKPEALLAKETFECTAHDFGCTSCSLDDEYGRCVAQCVKNLQKAGIEVEAYHMEEGVQQFEIATAPLPTVSSVDTLIQSQMIIRMTAITHGLRATFLPKPFPHLPTSGLHANVSFRTATDRTKGEMQGVDSQVGDAFLAGVLHRLPLLCAFGMPSQQSYSRIGEGMAGTWVAWGSQNKLLPVRRKGACYFEFKAIDSTANMYIALAAYLGAGILGIRQHAELRWHDCKGFTERLDAKTREEMGITTRLPVHLEESLALLDSSGDCMALEQIVGRELLSRYKFVKRAEILNLSTMTDNDRKNIYSKLF